MDLEKTRDEVIREAADKLKIVGTGQPLDIEYFDRLNRSLDPLFAQLARDGICEVVNDQHIPSEWFDAIAGLLANINAPLGGTAYDPRIKEYYEMQLKKLTSSGPTYGPQEAEYF